MHKNCIIEKSGYLCYNKNAGETVYEKIDDENIEMLGYIEILCEGIYQENGFKDHGLPATDIPKTIQYLNRITNDFAT